MALKNVVFCILTSIYTFYIIIYTRNCHLFAASSAKRPFEYISPAHHGQDAKAESVRSGNLLRTFCKRKNELTEFLEECRAGEYECEKPFCPLCARSFRRWFVGELLRITEHRSPVDILTVLIQQADRNRIDGLSPNSIRGTLRKRIARAGLNETPVLGGFEIVYRAKDKKWILHANLIIVGGEAAAIKRLEASFADSEIARASHRVSLNDAPEQLSYVLKFTTYHRPLGQWNSQKGPAKPLNAAEHYALVNWMSQFEFKDFLFLHRAHRIGSRIELRAISD
jgi:hypothetical protein